MSAEPWSGLLAALVADAAALGLPLSAAQADQFARFGALLLDENAHVNLTAITVPAEVVTRHFLDSLTCVLGVPARERGQSLRLLDIGSGAGFPGLALAIARPHWSVTSLEATGKKVRFQQSVIGRLGLDNAVVLAGRAEELAHTPEHRARYDVVTARALAALPSLLEYCAPFARPAGRVIAPKKGNLTDELAAGARAARILGAHLLAPIPITVPPLDDGRMLIVAEQRQPCPPVYPRAAGAPLKRPLGI
jgi:16S rRNA (guanine527-N7)-methyltransferase